MTRAWSSRLAWGFWAFTGAEIVLTVVLVELTDRPQPEQASLASWAAGFVAVQAFATVGALIASRRPDNAIGWLFCSGAALLGWANLAGAYVYLADEQDLPGVVWPSVVGAPSFLVGVVLIAVFGFLLFPDGHPLTVRWRRVLWAGVTLLAVEAVVMMLLPGELEGSPPGHVNPIGVPGMDVIAGIGWFLLLALLLASVVSLALRFRRSRGIERQQLKVFVGTVCFVVAALVAFALLHERTSVLAPLGGYTDVVWMLLVTLIPASVGVAILRYRLYDFDRVVSRTLVYGALTVILGAAYVGLVLAGQALFSSFAGGSNLAIAASTLVVAALFLPLRTRIQRVVDRRFNRRRYDAQRTLETFGSRLREEVDLETLSAELRGVVAETMQPRAVSLWLRQGTAP